MTIYHEDAPGQPNGRFGHSDAWREFCGLCQAAEMGYDRAELAGAPPTARSRSQSGQEGQDGPEIASEG